MKLAVFEARLEDRIRSHIRDVTPGLLLRAWLQGKQICDISVGETFPYYDLASLTKVIFSVQAMMWAFEKGRWDIKAKVKDYVSWFPDETVTVASLLSHSSGLVGWHPFYREIDMDRSHAERWQQVRHMISKLKIESSTVSVYSDVGFLVLADVLRSLFSKDLLEIWNEVKEVFYPGTTFEFHIDNRPLQRESLYAPTEECPWRGRLLRGEVHDENTWALGGVSTHAGLFGSIDDVGCYLMNLRGMLKGIGVHPIRMKTAQFFAERARPLGQGDWALGFMLPTPGAASCGSHFALNSIGHTGFTGTSVWYDPRADLGVVLLSNRLVYGRENEGFKKLRPQIHDWIVEGIQRTSF